MLTHVPPRMCSAAIFATAYQRYQFNGTNSTAEVMAVGDVLLQMITDTDTLLGTNVNYLLGPWISNAKYGGGGAAAASRCVRARNVCTRRG